MANVYFLPDNKVQVSFSNGDRLIVTKETAENELRLGIERCQKMKEALDEVEADYKGALEKLLYTPISWD